ncbi:recombinase family protein [Aliarcobacter butzleri]|uniref:recombinase family protein n=1 Tax=Aliarcobacter butzleri TaxID=28197 RepID=UPI001EDC0F61|nr:recombinase family protein [Aliarcobacter butzleri]MCG3693692.1 recombinase family protein [Aliarcobacter butzleri]
MRTPLFYGYARVSTSLQSLKNQRHEIFEYAHKNNMLIDKIIKIEISTTKNKKERLIDETLSKLTRGDVLIVTKLDRLGRSTVEVLQIIEDIKSKGIILHIIKDRLIIDGNISNQINDMLLTLLSGFAQMEKNFISERTKSALAQRKAQGIKLGRKKGAIVKSIYDKHFDTIKDLLNKQVTVSNISKIIGVGTRQSLGCYIKSRNLGGGEID